MDKRVAAPEAEPTGATSTLLSFGVYEADLRAGELFKRGRRLKIQPKPFAILAMLLKHPGRLVTRDAIRETLWTDTHLEFDQSLNTAVSKLREALGDSAESPRYIETLPGRGYRFLADVSRPDLASRPPTAGSEAATRGQPPAAPSSSASPPRRTWRRLLVLSGGGLGLLLLVALGLRFSTGSFRGAGVGTTGDRISLAVLPFSRSSGEPEYFSDGLTDEMISRLGVLNPEKLAVIARTSSMLYKDRAEPIRKIGRDLGVDYILEGSVRRAEDHLRINTQLIRVADETLVWGARYDRSLTDALAVQIQVAGEITGALSKELLGIDRGSASPPRFATRGLHPEAQELYLKGRFYLAKRTPSALQRAMALFERAVALEPDNALGHAAIADAELLLAFYQIVPSEEAMPVARAAAERALELDPDLPEAHTSLAAISLGHDWDWAAADRAYRRALELNPNYATAHHWYAILLLALGRTEAAIARLKDAEALDPLNLSVRADLALAYLYALDPDAAIAQCQSAMELDPHFAGLYSMMGLAYTQKGMIEEALDAYHQLEQLPGESMADLGIGHTQAIAGNREEALRRLAIVQERTPRTFYGEAVILAALGNLTEAVQALERAYRERDPDVTMLKSDPRLIPLHGHPGYQKLLETLDLHLPLSQTSLRPSP